MGSENEETMELQAEHLFLLMKKDYRISRNARAEWYFNHLNHTVQIPKADKVEHFKGDIEIVSAIPQETPIEWDWDTSHLYQYIIHFIELFCNISVCNKLNCSLQIYNYPFHCCDIFVSHLSSSSLPRSESFSCNCRLH